MQEKWTDVPGYEGLYRVSSLGRVKSLPKEWICGAKNNTKIFRHDGKILKEDKTNKGYLRVTLCKNKVIKRFSVHRLVLISFVGESKNLIAHHKNNNKSDNRLSNLEWSTQSENMNYSYAEGLSAKGEKRYNAILSDEQVLRIKIISENCTLYFGYWSKLSKALGMSQSAMSSIIHKKSWRHI